MSISLVVNAGGESRRMGEPKALLPMPQSGQPLLSHLLEQLAPLVTGVTVVVLNDQRLAGALGLGAEVEVVPDAYPTGGPLGGIATGLRLCPEWAIVLACDMPLVKPAVVRYLCSLTGPAWQAIVPVVDETPQPFHALYHRQLLPLIEKKLAAGIRRAASFLDEVPTRWVSEAELRPLDPALHSFINVNTPAEWAAACALLAR
jgi:molybdopterin-guanine dinucleotide biosynthesis protein A